MFEKAAHKSYFVGVTKHDPAKLTCPARNWTKRAGIIAFLFFLGKGLIWLGIIALGAYYSID